MKKKWWIVIGVVVLIVVLIVGSVFVSLDNEDEVQEVSEILEATRFEECIHYEGIRSEACYRWVGKNVGKVEYCKELTKQDDRNACMEGVGVATLDEYSCEQISGNDISRNGCLLHVAREKSDRTICDKINAISGDMGPYNVDMCLKDVAKIINDGDLCSEIVSDVERDHCYVGVSLNLKDVSICKDMVDEDYKIWCLAGGENCEDCEKKYYRFD